VCIPLFADQFYNAALVEFRGIGLTFDHHRVTGADLAKAIKDITVPNSLVRLAFFCYIFFLFTFQGCYVVISTMQMRPFSQICKCGRFLKYANVGVFSTMQIKNK
jgi:hypothetical protein